MTFAAILASYLALGAVAGTMAGLFGVGGGIIIVPVLVFAFGLAALVYSIDTEPETLRASTKEQIQHHRLPMHRRRAATMLFSLDTMISYFHLIQ